MNDTVLEKAPQIDEALWTAALDIIQRHTGYGRADITPDAEFEEDLGVDSIVLLTILVDLYEAYCLQNRSNAQGLRTVGDLVEHIRARIESEGGRAFPMVTMKPQSPVAETVIGAFQRRTGYDRRQLVEDACLQEDLGVDSITFVELLTEIAAILDLGAIEAPVGLRSIYDVIAFFERRSANPMSVKPREPDASISAPEAPRAAASPANELAACVLSSLKTDNPGFSDVDSLSFSAMGLNTNDVLTSLRKERRVPEVVRLADCDTKEKLAAFLRASEAHQIESLDAARERPAEAPKAYPASFDDDRTMRDFVGLTHRDLFHKAYEFRTFYRKKQAEQLYWYGMPLESKCQNRAVIYDEITGKRREFLMFASNNYLGLANHPKVVDAIADAARRYGATNTGCRLIGGSNVLHKELERRLAKLKGAEDAIVYPSGYSANLGCISALAGSDDLIFTDAINHMSIQDGCKLSGASKRIYPHTIESLERTLAKSADHPGGKLIVTDGVFSMHGDIVDLPRLIELAKEHGAKVLVDDAHATGVLGKTGSGTSEHFGMKGKVDLELGTFSKTLSGVGGFVAAKAEVVEFLRFYSNSYVFAATIPAPVAAGLIASIDIMETEPQRLSKLWTNIHYLRGLLLGAGFDLGDSASAIIPVVIGDDRKTLEFGRAVRARGMFCQTVVYPGVAVGDARLRISVTAEHTVQDLDLAAEILVSSAKDVGIAPDNRAANQKL
jgi:8-amino-7-oxononanoate synthase/acyl carrier protein